MKTITNSQNTFGVVQRAMSQAFEFIKHTYGPSENKILLGRPGSTMVIDDGVASLRQLELDDPAENEVLKVIKEICIRTNNKVGDGTTGSLIMAQAILSEVASFGKIDGKRITKELKKGFEELAVALRSKAKPIVSKADLKKVAEVSFDNEEIAELISSLLYKVGHEGVVTIEETGASKTTTESVRGTEIEKGYLSPYFVTNPDRMEAVLQKPYVLVTDYRLVANSDILGIMEKVLKSSRKSLVVFCESAEGDALATFVVNKVQGKFNSIVVELPRFGVDRREVMNDLALLTGATVISQESGLKTEDITLEHLGKCDKIVSTAEKTIIIGGDTKKVELAKTVAYLRDEIEKETSDLRKNELKQRLAKLQGKVSVIKIGAPTENELKALKYKVEDALNATKVAFKSGVVPGAGIALQNITTSSPILNNALKYPHKQLLENTGFTRGDIGKDVVDPVEVLIAGVESAVSIVSLLTSLKTICVDKPKDEKIPQ